MTIYGYPPAVRVEPAITPIYSGLPVSAASTWGPMAAGANWLNGYGACLIPFTANPGGTYNEVASTTTATWRFKAYTRSQAIERIWVAQVVGRVTESGGLAAVQAGGVGGTALFVSPTGQINQTVYVREILGSQSASLQELTFGIAVYGAYATVTGIGCWEQWRPVLLQSSDDHGVNTQSDIARERIYAGNVMSGVAESVTGTYFATEYADARRVGLYHWAVPDTNPWVCNSSSYGIQSPQYLPAPILTRKLYSGDTKGTVYWSAYVASLDFNPAYIRLTTSHSGVSSEVMFTNGSFAWTTPTAISVDCDDMTAVDGRQSSTWDDLTIDVKSDSGIDAYVASVCVWEQPP